MKPIKKFSAASTGSQSILESANLNPEALAELVQKLGYNNIDEIKKEKALLSKLEALLKEFSPKQDVSEDEAEEIEDKLKKLGEPKSLEDKAGEKEEDEEVGGTGEVAEEEETEEEKEAAKTEEDTAEEIEDTIVKLGEPEKEEEEEGEKVVTKDQEVTVEVPAEGDEEEAGKEIEIKKEEEKTPVAKRRIMTFEDFVKEEEETINKNVSYQDDEEEDEDNAVPVADSYTNEEDEEKEVEENVSRQVSSIKSFSRFVSESYLSEEADNGPALKGETADDNGITVPIAKGDGSKTAAAVADKITKLGEPKKKKETEGEELVTKDQKITKAAETSKDEPNVQGTVVVKEGKVTEKEIKSDSEFTEYATEILKSAHGDKFDEAKAKEVIDGLISKYKGDYGAMVGALQSSMGK